MNRYTKGGDGDSRRTWGSVAAKNGVEEEEMKGEQGRGREGSREKSDNPNPVEWAITI